MQTISQWTSAARAWARQHGVEPALDALVLPDTVQLDDYVELPAAAGPVTFIVRTRCWRPDAQGRAQLSITLDHPPRPRGL